MCTTTVTACMRLMLTLACPFCVISNMNSKQNKRWANFPSTWFITFKFYRGLFLLLMLSLKIEYNQYNFAWNWSVVNYNAVDQDTAITMIGLKCPLKSDVLPHSMSRRNTSDRRSYSTLHPDLIRFNSTDLRVKMNSKYLSSSDSISDKPWHHQFISKRVYCLSL